MLRLRLDTVHLGLRLRESNGGWSGIQSQVSTPDPRR